MATQFPFPTNNPAFSKVDPAYLEEIRKCIANGKLSLSIDAVYTMIRDKIAVAKGQEVRPMDVITTLKVAVSAGLDPTSDDVFAFKTGDHVIVGISKKGWSKIVDSRKASVSFTYGPEIPPRGPRAPSRFEWVAVSIKKADGSQVDGPRVYSDEFDQGRGVWTTNPKSMLATRAFTHACAIAFGIGAYDEDEARSIFTSNHPETPQEQPQVEEMPTPAAALSNAASIEELNQSFNALPLHARRNAANIEAYTNTKAKLENQHD